MAGAPEKTVRAQVEATLKFLHPPGGVFEICLIGPETATSPHWTGRARGKKPIVAGWFRDPKKAASLAVQVQAEGVYTTLNPCQDWLLARANERLKANIDRTQDKDIIHLRNLLIDFDPIRPAGISSTNAEHDAALAMVREIKEDLAGQGWSDPLVADSGNGGHLVYPLELENRPENVEMLKAILQALAWRYNTRLRKLNLELDQKVFNPARISKLYGTIAAKGENLSERPHRRAQILSLPAERVPLAVTLLQRMAKDAPSSVHPAAVGRDRGQEAPPAPGQFDMAGYLAKYGKEVVKVKAHGGASLYCLEECVFDPSHKGNEAAVGVAADGKFFYQCFHNSCKDKGWLEARAVISGMDKLGEFMSVVAGGGKKKRESPRGERGSSAPPEPPGQDFPSIVISHRFLHEKSAEALHALEQANEPPFLFVRAGALSRVLVDEAGTSCINRVDEMALRGMISRSAYFYKLSREGLTPTVPPMEIPRDILSLGEWFLPALEGINAMPIMRPDGSISCKPGYDPVTRLYYVADPSLSEFPQIPEDPSEKEMRKAKELLLNLLWDFPFGEEADRTNAVALLCTMPLRPAFAGLVPIAIITAPTPGTGKSLLADVVALIGTGKVAPMSGLPADEDETRKFITSEMEKGSPFICFDNVEGVIRSPSLARALTCTVWSDRVLGKNFITSLPQRAVWLATGNNVKLRGDLPRRTFPIRLDARMSKPWERENFKHPNLREWVWQWRVDLLEAIFTLSRGWFRAEQPAPDIDLPIVGGYEEWVRTMGGILAFAGFEGFLTNLDDFWGAADQEGMEWEAFMEAWWIRLGDHGVTCSELKQYFNESDELVEALPGRLQDILKDPKRSFERSLGNALASKEGRPYGDQNLAFQRAGSEKKIIRWKVGPLTRKK